MEENEDSVARAKAGKYSNGGWGNHSLGAACLEKFRAGLERKILLWTMCRLCRLSSGNQALPQAEKRRSASSPRSLRIDWYWVMRGACKSFPRYGRPRLYSLRPPLGGTVEQREASPGRVKLGEMRE